MCPGEENVCTVTFADPGFVDWSWHGAIDVIASDDRTFRFRSRDDGSGCFDIRAKLMTPDAQVCHADVHGLIHSVALHDFHLGWSIANTAASNLVAPLVRRPPVIRVTYVGSPQGADPTKLIYLDNSGPYDVVTSVLIRGRVEHLYKATPYVLDVELEPGASLLETDRVDPDAKTVTTDGQGAFEFRVRISERGYHWFAICATGANDLRTRLVVVGSIEVPHDLDETEPLAGPYGALPFREQERHLNEALATLTDGSFPAASASELANDELDKLVAKHTDGFATLEATRDSAIQSRLFYVWSAGDMLTHAPYATTSSGTIVELVWALPEVLRVARRCRDLAGPITIRVGDRELGLHDVDPQYADSDLFHLVDVADPEVRDAVPVRDPTAPVSVEYDRCTYLLHVHDFDVTGPRYAFFADRPDARDDEEAFRWAPCWLDLVGAHPDSVGWTVFAVPPTPRHIVIGALSFLGLLAHVAYTWKYTLSVAGPRCEFRARVPGTYQVGAASFAPSRWVGSLPGITDRVPWMSSSRLVEVEALHVALDLHSDDVDMVESEQGVEYVVSHDLDRVTFRYHVTLLGDGAMPPTRQRTPFQYVVEWSGTGIAQVGGGAESVSFDLPATAFRPGEYPRFSVTARLLAIVDPDDGTRYDLAPLDLRATREASIVPGEVSRVEMQIVAGAGPSRPFVPLTREVGDRLEREGAPRDEDIDDMIILREDATRSVTLGDYGQDLGTLGVFSRAPIASVENADASTPIEVRIPLKLSIKDRRGSPVEEGTPASVEVFGPGFTTATDDEVPPGQAPQLPSSWSTDAGGATWTWYTGPEVSLGNLFFKVVAGDKRYFVGNATAGVTIQLVDVGPACTHSVTNDRDVVTVSRVEKIHRDQCWIRLRCSLETVPVPPGTAVAFRIANGAVSASQAAADSKWAPEAIGVVGAGGIVTCWVSPHCHNKDGSAHVFKQSAWGRTKLLVTIGPRDAAAQPSNPTAKLEIDVDFDVVETKKLRPVVQFPRMSCIDLDTQTFLSRYPGTRGTDTRLDGVVQPEGESHLRVHGEFRPGAPERIAILEFREEEAPFYRPYATFGFARAAGGWNPTLVDESIPDGQYVSPAGFATHNLGLPAVRALLLVRPVTELQHAQVVQRNAPNGATRCLRLASKLGAVVGHAAGVRYATKVPGSAGFRITFSMLPTTSTSWEVIRVEEDTPPNPIGGDTSRLVIRHEGGTTQRLAVEYSAVACPDHRPTRVVAYSVPLSRSHTGWRRVEVTTEPSAKDRRTRVTLRIWMVTASGETLEVDESDEGSGFHYIPGDTYLLSLGVPQPATWVLVQGNDPGYLSALTYAVPRPHFRHLQRSDRLRTQWLMLPITSSAPIDVLLEKRDARDPGVPPAPPLPHRPGEVVIYAHLSIGYCDAPSQFETIAIPALERNLVTLFHYLKDLINAFLTGESQSWLGVIGDLAAGLLGWGDLRDIIIQLGYLVVDGGADFDWRIFALAVVGLALDVIQFFLPVAAVPNAFFAAAKSLLLRLRKVPADEVRAAKVLAGDITERVFAVLRAIHHMGAAALAAYSLNDLRKAVGAPLVDFLFGRLGDAEAITEAHLAEVIEFGRRLIGAPDPQVLNPIRWWSDPADQIDRLVLDPEKLVTIGNVARKIVLRVQVLTFFFNLRITPDLFEAISTSFYNLRRRLVLRGLASADETDRSVLSLLEASKGWDVPEWTRPRYLQNATKSQMRRHMVRAMKQLEGFIERSHLTGDELRGLLAFTAVCGPHRAWHLIRNFTEFSSNAPPRIMTEELKKVFKLCDIARRKATTLVDDLGQPLSPAKQARVLSNVWIGLSVRKRRGRSVSRRSVNGALCQLVSIAAAGSKVDRFNVRNPRNREIELWDFGGKLQIRSVGTLFTGRETKSFLGAVVDAADDTFRIHDASSEFVERALRMNEQYIRFARENHTLPAHRQIRFLDYDVVVGLEWSPAQIQALRALILAKLSRLRSGLLLTAERNPASVGVPPAFDVRILRCDVRPP